MALLEYCKTRKGFWRKANGTEEALSELSDEHLTKLLEVLEEGIHHTNSPPEPNAARDWYRAKVSK